MSVYDRILGTPFVYNHVRPLAVGGIDMSPFYNRVASQSGDTILDVGCGTGDALNYLRDFSKYVGIDTDKVAIRFAHEKHQGRPNVSFECRLCDEADLVELKPTQILCCGLLHHLSNPQALDLLRLAKASPRLQRIVTSDPVYLDNELLSNLFARFDRGRFCRREAEYKALVEDAGLRVVESAIVRSHPTRGLAKWLMMTIQP
ncbi:MAG TPA: class I SAM-dependent methyltransferase [Polyangiaceae bacterium]|jgi:cyclopropane fatty-acyl-phospholipid synthase-like methyltransferase